MAVAFAQNVAFSARLRLMHSQLMISEKGELVLQVIACPG